MSLETPKQNLETEAQISHENLQTIENLYGTFGKKTGRFFKHPEAINNYAYLFENHFPSEIIVVFERFPEIFFETSLFLDVTNRINQGVNFRLLQDLFLRYCGNEQELLKILNLLSQLKVNNSYIQIINMTIALLSNPRSESIISFEKYEVIFHFLNQNYFFNNPAFFLDLTKHISITPENLITLECENLNGFKQDLIIEILEIHKSFLSLETLQKIFNLDFVDLVKLKGMMAEKRFDLEFMFYNNGFNKASKINDKINALVHAVFMALN